MDGVGHGINLSQKTLSEHRNNDCLGNRSHPQLVVFDALQCSYRGWQKDMAETETMHLSCTDRFDTFVCAMKEKQRIYEGNRSHPWKTGMAQA